MNRFLLVTFMFPLAPKIDELEPAFYATGDDWIRISHTTWILWTSKPSGDIFNRLQAHLTTGDQVLITAIDLSEGYGSLTPWIWQWINSKIPGAIVTGVDLQRHLVLPPPTQKRS